jgi:hypothetical protein
MYRTESDCFLFFFYFFKQYKGKKARGKSLPLLMINGGEHPPRAFEKNVTKLKSQLFIISGLMTDGHYV